MPTSKRRKPRRPASRPKESAPAARHATVTSNRVVIGCVVALVLSSVVILPGALNRFVFPKLAAAVIAAAVACTVPVCGRLPKAVAVAAAFAAGWLLLAALLGDSPLPQLVGRAPRYEGVVTIGAYALAAFAGARLLGGRRKPGEDVALVRALAFAAVAVAVLAVLETAGLRPLSSDLDRPGSLLGNASDQGAWALLALGPLALRALRTRDVFAGFGAAAAVTAVALSGSRGAFVGLGALVVVMWFALDRRDARVLLVVGALAAGAVVLLVPATRERVSGTADFATSSVHGRRLLWDETLDLVADHPIVGVGPGGFVDAIPSYHTLRWMVDIGPAAPPDSPHNLVLELAAAGGLPLLGAAVYLAFVATRRAWPARRDPDWLRFGAFAGLVGYGAALLFHFTSPGATLLAALLFGVVVAERVSEGRPRSTDWVIGAAAAVLGVLLVLAAAAEIPLKRGFDALVAGDPAGADAEFATARTLRRWDPWLQALAGHGLLAVAEGGRTHALPLARERIASAHRDLPRSEAATTDLARVDDLQGRYAAAARLLDDELARDRYNPLLLLRRGVVAAKQGTLGGAERFFLAAASSAPRSPEPWTNLALVYDQQGRTADAAAARAKADRLSRAP